MHTPGKSAFIFFNVPYERRYFDESPNLDKIILRNVIVVVIVVVAALEGTE